MLINKCKNAGSKHCNNYKTFIECMDGTYKSIDEYNSNKKCKILIVSENMIADMLNNQKLNPINLFIRGRKLKISLLIKQSNFAVA